MEAASALLDECVESLPCRDLVLSKSPSEWLRLCHTRTMALEQQAVRLRDPPDQQALVADGVTIQQAEHYLRARERAVKRKAYMWKWNASMPPLVCQSFGLPGNPPQGMRIPLPSPSVILPSLPAQRPCDAQWSGMRFTWLQENHPRVLDARVQFHEEGHLYFVDGVAMDFSVTGLIDAYSEARPVANRFFSGPIFLNQYKEVSI